MSEIQIRRVHTVSDTDIQALSDVLIDCVEGGASVSFMHPMTREKADVFWRGVASAVARSERILVVAEDTSGQFVGTVQVVLNLPENQPHRGDVVKMLVHRRARNQGVGAALLAAAEQHARDAGKYLLVLDTITGHAGDRLYARHGWQRAGEIPIFVLLTAGRPCPTTYYYKQLAEMPERFSN